MLYIDFRPRQTCHSKDGRSAYSIGMGKFGWQYGTGLKSHGIVRLIHRKRVTCELHDSYFRSMTIKHAIPKMAEVTHSDGQLWGDIEWAIELLYNSVKTGSQLFWKPDQFGEKMRQRKTALGAQGLRLSSPENGKETRLWPIEWGSICFAVRFPTPSHMQTFQIKREVYFSKNCALVFIVSSLWLCMHM